MRPLRVSTATARRPVPFAITEKLRVAIRVVASPIKLSLSVIAPRRIEPGDRLKPNSPWENLGPGVGLRALMMDWS